ncbi:FlaG family protein [Helicobacter cetorum]|uniref:Flagellar protein FlaG n=1 Tax=Helicobacter cetorum (strain ATCC BAA-540 / CCUG 52418 / MIT 99-5656) TaxID=1163745 RepID=I0ETW1_HELCM|nr:FlaG family protein [Helicobacter cetorum]AFI06380.1 flagellar protein FlaG [Helicobacter cetorum MIT 99-5656]
MISEIQGDVRGVSGVSQARIQTTHVGQVNRASALDESKMAIEPEQYKPKLELLSERLNEEMKRIGTDIDFSYNDEIKGLVVSVKDANGGKVLREIPSKEAVELMQRMRDVIGIIFDKKG